MAKRSAPEQKPNVLNLQIGFEISDEVSAPARVASVYGYLDDSGVVRMWTPATRIDSMDDVRLLMLRLVELVNGIH
jgi:hypothetical protein